MAWIESHQELARHPKTKKLARLLGVSVPAAVGHLHFLWWWALDYAQDGSLDRYDHDDIADACGWDGDAEVIFNALIESGFFDKTESGIVIHDWMEYAGKFVNSKLSASEAGLIGNHKRWHVGRGIIDPNCPHCIADYLVESGANRGDHQSESPPRSGFIAHNLTIPNHTEPINKAVVVGEGFLDERLAKVVRVFNDEGFGTLSDSLRETLVELIDEYTDEWVVRAMHIASRKGKRFLNFVIGILKRWKAEGIDEPWNQERTEKVTPYPSRTNRTRSNKPHIPVVEQRTGGEKLSDDELQEAIRLAQELEGA